MLTPAELRAFETRLLAEKNNIGFRLTIGLALRYEVKKRGIYGYYDYTRPAGGANVISYGALHDVPLRRAWQKHLENREALAAGIDPAVKREQEKAAAGETLRVVAEEHFKLRAKTKDAQYIARERQRVATHILPTLGDLPMVTIKPAQLLRPLKKIEARGTYETALRTREVCGRIWRYGVATGRCEHDITRDLRDALVVPPEVHYPSITTPKEVGQLLRVVWGYKGLPVIEIAMKLLPYLFVRSAEFRGAKWTEFDLDNALWRIPASRMKARVQHLVPLPRQAVALLRELRELTGHRPFLFPSAIHASDRCISENTINAALSRLGYGKGIHTSHSFRSMASTLLNERGFNRDWIERQLAHGERDDIRAAYNYAEFMPERAAMMQTFADLLDELRTGGAKVVPLRAA